MYDDPDMYMYVLYVTNITGGLICMMTLIRKQATISSTANIGIVN